MVSDTVSTALRDVSLFRQLSPQELESLSREVVQRRYSRNEIIFSQGDRGDGLYIVRDGHVSINRQNPDGDELMLAVYEPGEYFGELALFDQLPRSASAVCIDDVSALFLSRSDFRRFLEGHQNAVFTCLETVVHLLRNLTDLADEIALMDVRSRLARRLLRLAQQGVVETGADAQQRGRGSFRITQQHLASMTGATRESVNKHLNAFVDEGLIRLEHGHIRILDREGLEAASEGHV